MSPPCEVQHSSNTCDTSSSDAQLASHVRDNRTFCYAVSVTILLMWLANIHLTLSSASVLLNPAPSQQHLHSEGPPLSIVLLTVLEYAILTYCTVDICTSPCLVSFDAQERRPTTPGGGGSDDGMVTFTVEYNYVLPWLVASKRHVAHIVPGKDTVALACREFSNFEEPGVAVWLTVTNAEGNVVFQYPVDLHLYPRACLRRCCRWWCSYDEWDRQQLRKWCALMADCVPAQHCECPDIDNVSDSSLSLEDIV